ncbi:hypothetical protein PVAND_005632 [Polypedilum vanderplanki]|uniref:BHLH domain-containing protein n=1 Tax=Polypedilum vanderplanki TaxID=319348 RepID=A0A9J6C169_POLVA|nr:hypothetical protein PVAND_005632 [Polypedilum vanderplanki]
MEKHLEHQRITEEDDDKMEIKLEDIKTDVIINESIQEEQCKNNENMQIKVETMPMSNSNNDINHDSSTRGLTASEKRLYHNALERKRRELINLQFLDLHNAIPSIAGLKASRTQVLIKATEFINIMKRKVRKYELEIESLKNQNKKLENILCSLKDNKRSDKSRKFHEQIIFEDDEEVVIDDEIETE